MMALCVTPNIPNVQTWTGLNQESRYFANFSSVSYCFGKVTSSSWTTDFEWGKRTQPTARQSHTNLYKLEMPDSEMANPRPHQILCGQVIQEITWRSWRISMKATQTAWGLFSNDCCRTRQRTSLTHLSKEKLQVSQYRSNLRKL